MKKINKLFLFAGLAIGTSSLTSCLEETFLMSSTATEEQVQESPAATEALVMGMPAKSCLVQPRLAPISRQTTTWLRG